MPQLTPHEPIFRKRKIMGSIRPGNTPVGDPCAPTDILRQALLDLSPYSMWDLDPAVATDLGSLGNTGYFVIVPTVFEVGPDCVEHPLLGDEYAKLWSTDNQDYGGVYTTGMTFVHMFKGTVATSGGYSMVKAKPDDLVDRGCCLIGNSELFGQSMRITDLTARGIESTDDPILLEQWNMFEVYYPPGNATPVIYVNGAAPASSSFTPGTVGDNGDGYMLVGGDYIFTAGSNPQSASHAEGFYALPAVYMGGLTSGDRSGLVTAAQTEGWIP